jgi:hypothetical protein
MYAMVRWGDAYRKSIQISARISLKCHSDLNESQVPYFTLYKKLIMVVANISENKIEGMRKVGRPRMR